MTESQRLPWIRQPSLPRRLSVLLGALLFTRVLFLVLVPSDVVSDDINHWIDVANALNQDSNPYRTTTYLNWPPFWMQIIHFANQVAGMFGWQLVRVLQAVLVTAEAVAVASAYLLGTRLAPSHNWLRIFVVGVVANPVALLLICQHGNFDVLVGAEVVLAIGALVLFHERGRDDVALWLWACLFVGVGILTKTVPVLLVPLLLIGVRRLDWSQRMLGAVLAGAPVTLGLSIIYVLAPHGTLNNVIHYRSSSGYYGLTGLLSLTDAPAINAAYAASFPYLLLLAFLVACYKTVRMKTAPGRTIVLAGALFLLALPTLGPGYAPQYAYWYLPLLVLSYPLFEARWRVSLWITFGVVGATYLFEYGMFASHGQFALHVLRTAEIREKARELTQPGNQTLIRIPLFAAHLWLLAQGGMLLASARKRVVHPIGSPGLTV